MLIYIASPYSKGDTGGNVHAQMEAAHRILNMGHTPYWPLESHFLHVMRPRSYDTWLQKDLEILRRMDIVLRLPGESAGADREVREATSAGIPVAFGWGELTDLLRPRTESRKETSSPTLKDAREELARLTSGSTKANPPDNDSLLFHKTVHCSPFGNTCGGLNLIVAGPDREVYLEMQDCFGPDYFGPMTEEQINAFWVLCGVAEASPGDL